MWLLENFQPHMLHSMGQTLLSPEPAQGLARAGFQAVFAE